MKKVLFYIGLITLLNACFEQGDCTDVSSNIMMVGFYDFGTKAPKTISLDSITTNANGLSLTLFKAQSKSTVSLPLHPDLEHMTYSLYFGNSVSILDVQYKVRTFNLSPECNAINLYSISDATGVSIYQIIFTQKAISKDVKENLKLFF